MKLVDAIRGRILVFLGMLLLIVSTNTFASAPRQFNGRPIQGNTVHFRDFAAERDLQRGPSNRYATEDSGAATASSQGPKDSCYGACCDPINGSCENNVYVYDCQSSTFVAGATCGDFPCPPIGACCYLSTGVCMDEVAVTTCPQFPEAEFYQDLSCGDIECQLPPLGACCEENDGTCVDGVTAIDCAFNSNLGVFTQDAVCGEISCPSLGACCNSFTGECVSESTLVDCFTSGGDTITLNQDCDQIECPERGLCCNFDSSCTDDVGFFECESGFWDPTITCGEIECPVVQTGACCNASEGLCLDVIPQPDCLFGLGGTWHPEFTCDQIVCPPMGACCSEITPMPCIDQISRIDCENEAAGLWYVNRLCAELSCEASTACGGQNLNFETGNFTGWVALDIEVPYFPLEVAGADQSTYPCFFFTDPTEGQLAAIHGWDGDGPDVISLSQDLNLPVSATVLKYDYRASWLLTFGATMDRTFAVTLQRTMPGPHLWGPELVLTAPAGGVEADTGNLTGGIDISAFAGSPARIYFEWTVPESFVGPAQFQLDNVRCDAPTLSPSTFSGFVNCLTGPGSDHPSKECLSEQFPAADAVTNNRVDLRDFRVLAIGFVP